MMDKHDEIKAGLRNAGVPDMVIASTLPNEGQADLREMITNKVLVRPESAHGLFIYPKKKAAISHARKVFYLVAKELFLSGVTVYCIPLSRLVEALTGNDYGMEMHRADSVRMVFVLDFFEEGAPFPLQANDASRLRSWVRSKFEEGGSVSFLSDAPTDRCIPWWPASFLGFINDNVITQAIDK